MLKPHGDLTDHGTVLTNEEEAAINDGQCVVRGNGKYCTESWIAEGNYPDRWNKWTCVRPEPGYWLFDYGGPGGRPSRLLQTTTDIWWFGRYRGVAYFHRYSGLGRYKRYLMF